jgi:DnaJ-domain-containing protein 1
MTKFLSNLDWCYQTLGLERSAKVEEIKAAYRQLVKRYHPDRNPGNQAAVEQFIRINRAYETLIAAVEQLQPRSEELRFKPVTQPEQTVSRAQRHASPPPGRLTPEQSRLKQRALEQMQFLLQQQRWQQSVQRAEELGRQLPHDPEIGQVRAKAYHGWARTLLSRRRYEEARPYLQKAIKADSGNRQLWEEIERDYWQIERGLRL